MYYLNQIDTFVKVILMSSDGKKIKKKKTLTQKASTSPVFNEEIVFTKLKKEHLENIEIMFTIYHDSLTSRENLGVISIGSTSSGNELTQWKDMLDGKKTIVWWHELKAHESENIDSDINNGGSQSKINGLFERKSSKSNLLNNLSNLKIKPV